MSISDFPCAPLPKDVNCRRLRGFRLDVCRDEEGNSNGLCENCTYAPSTHVFNIGATQHHLCAKCFAEMLMCFVGESVVHSVAHQREMKERDERIDRALRVLREAVGGIKPPVDADSSEVYQDARYEDGKFVGKPLPHSVCADWYAAIVKAQSILSGDEAKSTPPPPKEEHPAPPAKEAEPQKCHPCVDWHGCHCYNDNVLYGERGERIGSFSPYICPCDTRCIYYRPDTSRPKIW